MTEKTKKVLKITGIMALVFFVLLLLFAFVLIPILVNTGYLTKFDGKWYTSRQLKKAFPTQYYEAPAKNTPEEVYTAFREAVLVGDVEGALGYVTIEKREKYKMILVEEKKLDNYKMLPEVGKIKKNTNESRGNFAYYSYVDNQQEYSIEFVKNRDGYWEIDMI